MTPPPDTGDTGDTSNTRAISPDDAASWDSYYAGGNMPWDLGRPAPAFVELMSGDSVPVPGSLISLGCGRGHDAIFFAAQGFTVTAVDFAPSALDAARELAAEAAVQVRFAQEDIFALPESYSGGFNYVLEHTCFAAIPPERRQEYVRVVHDLLKPGGLYIAILFAHGRTGGPPFTTTLDEVRALFKPFFKIERLEVAEHSVPARKGKELFSLMRPRK